MLARYGLNGSGAAFWVSSKSEPHNLTALLKAHEIHCRKYYPGMYCDLTRALPDTQARVPIRFETVSDYSIFRRLEHPSMGRISTSIRRFGLNMSNPANCMYATKILGNCSLFWAMNRSGICTLFVGAQHAGIFDVGVLERHRKQGIGRALVRQACAIAKEKGRLTCS